MTEREKMLKSCEDLTDKEIARVRDFIFGLKINRPVRIITIVEREASWAALKSAAQNGALKSGDKIPVTLKNGELITLTVGHDESGKAYFCFEDCLEDTRPVNDENTTAGGWKAFDIRAWLNNDLFALLPDDLQAIIEPTEIVQIIGGQRVVTKDKLFLFSKTRGRTALARPTTAPRAVCVRSTITAMRTLSMPTVAEASPPAFVSPNHNQSPPAKAGGIRHSYTIGGE